MDNSENDMESVLSETRTRDDSKKKPKDDQKASIGQAIGDLLYGVLKSKITWCIIIGIGLLIAAIIVLPIITGKHNNTGNNGGSNGVVKKPSGDGDEPEDDPDKEERDALAKEIFAEAEQRIRLLVTEGPCNGLALVTTKEGHETTKVKDVTYYKTTSAYEDIVTKYSDVFMGTALDYVLSPKYLDVEGTLYCMDTDPIEGWGIANLEIKSASSSRGTYGYIASFNTVTGTGEPGDDYKESTKITTSIFAIAKDENEEGEYTYKVSSINYLKEYFK